MNIKPKIREVSYERTVVGVTLSHSDVRFQPQDWSDTAQKNVYMGQKSECH
jgi:hypothetical protein